MHILGISISRMKKVAHIINIRDWSLITARGGLQNGRGGDFYPYEKGGREKF